MSIPYQNIAVADISSMLDNFAFAYHYVVSQPHVNSIRGSWILRPKIILQNISVLKIIYYTLDKPRKLSVFDVSINTNFSLIIEDTSQC